MSEESTVDDGEDEVLDGEDADDLEVVSLDEADLDDDLVDEGLDDDLLDDGDEVAVVGGDDDDEVVEAEEVVDPPVRPRRAGEDEEEEEEALDPDDVEADLSTILKDRLDSSEEEDEDEDDEEQAPRAPAESGDGMTAKKEGEFTCPGCFMLVHPRQFGRKQNATCPFGEEICPGINLAFGTAG